jgi:hypothetical protein
MVVFLYTPGKSILPHCTREEEPGKTEMINTVLLASDLLINPLLVSKFFICPTAKVLLVCSICIYTQDTSGSIDEDT